MSTEVAIALIAAFAPIMAALGVLLAKIGGVPKQLKEVHELVNSRMTEVLRQLAASEAKQVVSDAQIATLERLVTLMTPPPVAVVVTDQSLNRKAQLP